jgi:hypothetical protein
MRNARGMDGGDDAEQGGNWSTRVALATSIHTRRALVVRPGRLVAGVSLWLLTTAALLCVSPTLAQATSFYWYGENDSTCWQTGQLGSPSTACGESVGSGFLSKSGSLKGGLAHMDEVSAGGSAEGIQLPDGNYCNYYKIGDDISREESNNQGGATGYTPPTPYKSYQESDPYGNVCQADGATWGQEVGTGDSGNNCYNTCGMHHIVSLHELSDHPWASWFGEPSLAVSTEALVHTVTFSGESTSNMAWGYVCPLFEDTEKETAPRPILEYCFEEWRSVYNPPKWKNERIGACGPNGYDTVVTYFWPGTTLATEQGGSANTFEFSGTPSGWTSFAAKITEANLLAAINLAKKSPEESGCGTILSTNPEKYALVGVEQGVEGEHKLSGIGGAGRNLEVRTEYTPLPPEVSTGAASEVQSTQAKLNGTVNPKGTNTHYYFQYGTTTSYGSSTPEGDAGSGLSSVPESASITGLEPGTTYHYRFVASSSAGTSYGADQTFFTTPALTYAPGEYGSLQQVFYVGSGGTVYEAFMNSSGVWTTEAVSSGYGASGHVTWATGEHGSEQQVFYVGSGGTVYSAYMVSGVWTTEAVSSGYGASGQVTWATGEHGSEQQVFYVGSGGTVYSAYMVSGVWTTEAVSSGYGASGQVTWATGEYGSLQQVFYVGSGGTVYSAYMVSGVWTTEAIASEA